MRLQNIIRLISIPEIIIFSVSFLGFIYSLYYLEGLKFISAISILIFLHLTNQFLKSYFFVKIINKCKYPFELNSLIEQIGIGKRIMIQQITFRKESIKNRGSETQEFLKYNFLTPEIWENSTRNLKGIIISLIILLLCWFFYLNKYFDQIQNQWAIGLTALFFIIIAFTYRAIKLRSKSNKPEPVIIFTESEFIFYSKKVKWSLINDWNLVSGREYSRGQIVIGYQDSNRRKELIAELDNLNVKRMDMLLLLAHFKFKFGDLEN